MAETANLKLITTPEATDKTFKEWRLEMDGVSNSNMTKIDDAFGNISDAKMERYVIRLVKNADDSYKMTSLDDTDLTFNEVYNVTKKLNEYVVVVYGNSKLRPQYISTNEMMFIGLDRSTETKILRILYTPTRLTYETFRLAEYDDLDATESLLSASITDIEDDVYEVEIGKVEKEINLNTIVWKNDYQLGSTGLWRVQSGWIASEVFIPIPQEATEFYLIVDEGYRPNYCIYSSDSEDSVIGSRVNCNNVAVPVKDARFDVDLSTGAKFIRLCMPASSIDDISHFSLNYAYYGGNKKLKLATVEEVKYVKEQISESIDEISDAIFSFGDFKEQISESIDEISNAIFSFGDFSEIIPDEGYPIYGKVCNLKTQLPQDSTSAMYAKYTIRRNRSNIKVSGESRASVPAFALGAFYDDKGVIISVFGESASTKYTQEEIEIPSNASYVIVNGDYPLQSGVRVPYLAVEQAEIVDNVMKHDKSNISMNHWYGKKIVLLGTSVGYGQNADTNYITECARKLGFSFVNTSVPGMAICLDDDGTPCDNKTYASVLSLQEYADIGYTVPSDKSDSHYYCSWERIFTEETADADLYIFAVAPNNSRFETTDWDAFDKTNWRYTDGSSFESHRTTFLGGLLFLMNKMYELNPNARMCIVVDSNFRYGQYGATPNLETFVKQYKIPYIDLWGKINGTPQSLRLMYSLNGTDQHPSTMAHKIMGKMLVGELMSIS